jgi:hypothetical protein
MQYARESLNQFQQKYFVLLIITDGVITDMEATVSKIVEASALPLSIVIVGVGQANFDAMNFLDSDGKSLKDVDGRIALRDIVQFVPFRKYKNLHYSELAKDVLAEIPGQLLEYFTHKGIAPNQRM